MLAQSPSADKPGIVEESTSLSNNFRVRSLDHSSSFSLTAENLDMLYKNTNRIRGFYSRSVHRGKHYVQFVCSKFIRLLELTFEYRGCVGSELMGHKLADLVA